MSTNTIFKSSAIAAMTLAGLSVTVAANAQSSRYGNVYDYESGRNCGQACAAPAPQTHTTSRYGHTAARTVAPAPVYVDCAAMGTCAPQPRTVYTQPAPVQYQAAPTYTAPALIVLLVQRLSLMALAWSQAIQLRRQVMALVLAILHLAIQPQRQCPLIAQPVQRRNLMAHVCKAQAIAQHLAMVLVPAILRQALAIVHQAILQHPQRRQIAQLVQQLNLMVRVWKAALAQRHTQEAV